ncbi:MAG: insulinase family protein, partial [Deltaproteobacteria bacterium]|nr:insulinase family protein [Deltaproteobacteria bacterium]
PYGMPLNGTAESVTGITRDNLVEFYEAHFAPERMIVTIVGDVDSDYAIEKIKKTLGAFKRQSRPLLNPRPEKRPEEIRQVQDSKDKAQTHIALGFIGTTATSPDNPAMDVLTEILSSQGGRLFFELRDKLGLAYSVSAMSRPGVDQGLFAVYIATAPEKKDEAINGILKELGKILSETVTNEELQRAKSALIGGYELGLQDVMSQASDMAINELLGMGYDHFRRYATEIEGVSQTDILDVARKYITLDGYAIAIVGH